MLEIWMDHDNITKIRIVVSDQSNQQFETMTYHKARYNFGSSHFLLYHFAQDSDMLEIWMDDDNETKVRIVVSR